MKFLVKKSKINGEIEVPGSKSHTIRAVAIASMADGTSYIRSPLISEDTLSSLNAARSFGAEIDCREGVWIIKGVGGKIQSPKGVVDLGNSGTSLRIFTGLAALSGFEYSFDGDSSLRTRLMSNLLDALAPLGVANTSKSGKCPLSVKGPLRGGSTKVNGQSSQFLTSLLFAAPLASEDTFIEVEHLNEVPYVEITMDWMQRQGIVFEHAPDLSWFKIRGNQAYKPFDAVIPADFSTATFPLMAAAITGGCVKIKNLDFTDRQGDKEVFDYFSRMGLEIERHDGYTIARSGRNFSGVKIDMNRTPDALPAMAVAGVFANGTTELQNVPQARIKETDRIACMTRELAKMGADITELPDGMVIKNSTLHATEVDGCGDHRIVMSLAIAGMAIDGETIITTAEAAAVTYPDFAEDFRKIRADITIIGE